MEQSPSASPTVGRSPSADVPPSPTVVVGAENTSVTLDLESFRALFEYLDETVICIDPDGHIRFVSAGIRELLGYDPEAMVGRSVLDYLHADDLDEVSDAMERWQGRAGSPLGHQLRVRAIDGKWREVRYDARVGVEMGDLGSLVLTLHSPDARSHEVASLRQRLLVEDRLTRLATIVLHAPYERFEEALVEAASELGRLDWMGRVSVWTVDPVDPGRALRRAQWTAPVGGPRMGLSRQVLLDSSATLRSLRRGQEVHIDSRSVLSPELLSHERRAFRALGLESALAVPLSIDEVFLGFLLLESATGDVAHDSLTTATARVAATFLAGALKRHAAEFRLAHQAHTDRVTGLGNRWAFEDALRQALAAVAAGTSVGFGLALVDLDRFKLVNDALGHAAGDQLLRKIATRLLGAVDNETVLGRLGGDELLVLLHNSATRADTQRRMDRLIGALNAPFDVAGHAMQVTASIGAVHVTDTLVGPGELLRRADVAMYRAKGLGGHTLEFDRPDSAGDDGASLRRELELRDAIRAGALTVHYQGEWDLSSGVLLGAEALVRWPHPSLGLLAAGEFVPLAEERGLVAELGWTVLREACRVALPWVSLREPDGFLLRVNVAADQLRDADFAQRVWAVLDELHFPPSGLCLELTESTLLADPRGSAVLFAQLRESGIGLAIDDFGTGYSSMLQLKRLPLSTLKIDRSFVGGLPDSSIDRAVVRSSVQLAEALGASVTAEGVERPEQVEALLRLGCTRAQGYLLARPEPPEQFDARVAQRAS